MRAFTPLLLALGLTLSIPSMAATPGDNAELAALYEADQAARRQPSIDWPRLNAEDGIRRARVRAIMAGGGLRSAADHHHAAMVFQHGDTLEDYRLAFALATMAAAIDPDYPRAHWLSAAAFDRMLMSRLAPQWYGTQYRSDSQGMYLYPVDAEAVTDAEREAMGVPTLAASQARVAEGAERLGMPVRTSAPTLEALRAERAAAAAGKASE